MRRSARAGTASWSRCHGQVITLILLKILPFILREPRHERRCGSNQSIFSVLLSLPKYDPSRSILVVEKCYITGNAWLHSFGGLLYPDEAPEE